MDSHLNQEDREHAALETICADYSQSTPSVRESILRWFNILKYYRWDQLNRRGISLLRKRLGVAPSRVAGAAANLTWRTKPRTAFQSLSQLVISHWRNNVAPPRVDLIAGRIQLLGETSRIGIPISWAVASRQAPTALWRFQLHYHEFIVDWLVANNDEGRGEPTRADALDSAIQAIDSWIQAFPDANAQDDPAAWHPYCISRRLPVWLWIIHGCAPEAVADKWLDRIWAQSNYLSFHLEHDPGGNHLLENLTTLALMAAAIQCSDAERWFNLVHQHLKHELRRQLLPSGEHIERCPMYHTHILGNLLRVIVACRAVNPGIATTCYQAAERMTSFLAQILHPDGEIPLLGDSVFGEAPSVSQIQSLSALAGIRFPLPDFGITASPDYWIYRSHSTFAIFDCGQVGCSWLPAHAHCDLLGIEMSWRGRRWIVDSGNYNYEDDEMRGYCRSTLAHNATTLGGFNQCDVWSKFRMGYRGVAGGVCHGRAGRFMWAAAHHDGYRRLGSRKLHRLLAIDDTIWVCLDWCTTPPRYPLIGALHLADQISVRSLGNMDFEVRFGEDCRVITFWGVEVVRQLRSPYCTEFGRRRAAAAFLFKAAKDYGGPLGWISWPLDQRRCRLQYDAGIVKILEDDSSETQEKVIGEWNLDAIACR